VLAAAASARQRRLGAAVFGHPNRPFTGIDANNSRQQCIHLRAIRACAETHTHTHTHTHVFIRKHRIRLNRFLLTFQLRTFES
jgi:hypothetical protein